MADILSDPDVMLIAVETHSITVETNRHGRQVEGLFLDGVRILDVKTSALLGGETIFVVNDPVVEGLIRSQYLELKNEASSRISSPIRFTSYQTGVLLTTTVNQEIVQSQKLRFAHITLRIKGIEIHRGQP